MNLLVEDGNFLTALESRLQFPLLNYSADNLELQVELNKIGSLGYLELLIYSHFIALITL